MRMQATRIDHHDRRGASQAGQAVVEFGLIAVLAFALLLGGIDFARLFYTQMAVTNASRVGAQWMIDPRNCGHLDEAERVVRREAGPFVTFSQVSLPTTPCNAYSDFSVQVKTNFYFITPFMANLLGSANPRIVTGTTTARFRQT